MTKTLAAVLAALVTASTVYGAGAVADRQFARTEAASSMQVLAAQTVVVVGRRA